MSCRATKDRKWTNLRFFKCNHRKHQQKLEYAAYKREKAEERQVRLLRKVNRSVQKISEDADYLSCYLQRFRRKPHI